jgi:hypothetical protein
LRRLRRQEERRDLALAPLQQRLDFVGAVNAMLVEDQEDLVLDALGQSLEERADRVRAVEAGR